jgi:uncharacterized protein (TIGR02217 family)
LANGFEERNTPWEHSRRRYNAGIGLRSLDDLEVLLSFFEARRGQLNAFRWKDWSDYKSGQPSKPRHYTDQVLGWGDGVTTQYQLLKTYRSGDQTYARPIDKPVVGTVSVGLKGDPLIEGAHYTVDHETGMLSFATAPQEGAEIQAGFEFDVPVRFDTDRVHTSIASFQAGDALDIPVIEVRV